MPKFKEKPTMGKPKSKLSPRIPLKQLQAQAAKLKQQAKQSSEEQPPRSDYAVERVEQVSGDVSREAGRTAFAAVKSGVNRIRTSGERRIRESNVLKRAAQTASSRGARAFNRTATRRGKAVEPVANMRHTFVREKPRKNVAKAASTPAKTRGRAVFRSKEGIAGKHSTRMFKVKPSIGRSRAASKKMRQVAQRQMSRRAAQTAKQVAQTARRAAKTAMNVAKAVIKAAVRAAMSLVGNLVGLLGGGGLLILILFVTVVAAVVSSPFGLFFASDSSEPTVETVAVCEAVAQINAEYSDELERVQEGIYDTVELNGQMPDWANVLAVFSSKYAAADDGVDVATLDADRVDKLSDVFWDMTAIASEKESVYHEDTDPEDGMDDSYTEVVLRITVTTKTTDEMAGEYGFTDYQVSAMTDMLAERDGLLALAGSLEITDEDVLDVLNALPDDLPADRKIVAETALRLVGKVGYFWGGKSTAIGWDSRWGHLAKVTADGSSTTGTYRPFGLDCTGFLDWTLRNAGLHSDVQWHIGTNLTAVSEADAQVGDFVLNADNSHIGMIVGRDEDGELLVCHCTADSGVVVTGYGTGGFAKMGAPTVYGDGQERASN